MDVYVPGVNANGIGNATKHHLNASLVVCEDVSQVQHLCHVFSIRRTPQLVKSFPEKVSEAQTPPQPTTTITSTHTHTNSTPDKDKAAEGLRTLSGSIKSRRRTFSGYRDFRPGESHGGGLYTEFLSSVLSR